MGIPSEMRDAWASRTKNNASFIAFPAEEQRIRNARKCTQEGVRAGAKAASIACVATAVPTLAAVRLVPWAKANLNYTAQALIISAASIAAYFITADKTILECARRNAQYEKSAQVNRILILVFSCCMYVSLIKLLTILQELMKGYECF